MSIEGDTVLRDTENERPPHELSFSSPACRISRAAHRAGICGVLHGAADIAAYLTLGPGVPDPYMCLADFESYHMTRQQAIRDYADKEKWNRMSLKNIAAAGYFAADRSINDYARTIWNLRRMVETDPK